MATQQGAPARRVTKRRAETRTRLLDAALEVFAEEGFGRSTVEQVCERAGYTRGAFYSNFASLDELFLAMWEQRSQAQLARMREIAEAVVRADEPVGTVVARLAGALPVDERWYRVSAEFTVHALRHPELRQVIAAREEAIIAAMVPPLLGVLARLGRVVPDPGALGRALVAVHDGTAAQCALEPGNPEVWRQRTDLFVHVVSAYSTKDTHQ